MSPDLAKVRMLAKDLRKLPPPSPREKLGGYVIVIAARCTDKCRAFLLNMNGEYNHWPTRASQEVRTTASTSIQVGVRASL